MSASQQYVVGDVVLTRVPYFDVTLPPESVALTSAQIGAIPWATPIWAESADAIRVGQVFWVIEADGRTIVVDPCCASDDFLRTGTAALEHQDAAFGAFAAVGSERSDGSLPSNRARLPARPRSILREPAEPGARR